MIEDEDLTSAPIRLSSRQVAPGVLAVRVCGDIDSETAPTVAAYLAQATSAGPAHLVLDLASVTFLSSAGLSLLLRAQDDAGARSGVLHLVGVEGNRVVERPLALMGLRELFDVRADVDAVVRSASAH